MPLSEDELAQDPCTGYARQVVAKEIVAGPHVRAACERHLRDLAEGPKRGLVWRPEMAARIYQFCAALELADGEDDGRPFYLELFQCFIAGSLFGWYGSDGFRRFRTGYVEIGKGNGKTPLAAAIGLYCLVADGEAGAEVYSSAVSREQAMICFRDVKRFAQGSPALGRRLVIGDRNIADTATGSFFRPLANEGKSLDGKRVHASIIDELHEHQSSVVVDKMRAGTKGRKQALIFEITNSGADRQSICYQHHDYSLRVLRGAAVDDSWFAYVCALDEGDDPLHDESCWIKANPNIGVSITLKYLREQVREALGMPAKQNIVKRLNFCQWTDSVSAWISADKWDAVQVPADRAPLAGRDCYLGLDLSGKTDLTALAAWFPDDDGTAGELFVDFFTPKDTLAMRELRDRAPYLDWVRDGHLIAVPGSALDYSAVALHIREACGLYRVRLLAFDRYRMDDLQRELAKLDMDVRLLKTEQDLDEYRATMGDASILWIAPFGQGFKDMGRGVELLEGRILNTLIRIHKSPVLTSCAACAVLEEDAAGNRKWTKKRATGRIDGIVAATMAVAVDIPQEPAEDMAGLDEFLKGPIVIQYNQAGQRAWP